MLIIGSQRPDDSRRAFLAVITGPHGVVALQQHLRPDQVQLRIGSWRQLRFSVMYSTWPFRLAANAMYCAGVRVSS